MASINLSAASQPPDIQIIDVAPFFSVPDVAVCGMLHPSSDGLSTIGVFTSQESPQNKSAVLTDSSISLDRIKSSLPAKYHSFAQLFQDKEVEILAPHRSQHDIKIEIEEGKSPPFGPIYSLTQVERETLRKYIDNMLHRGFIQPSTSPAASPILFVKKANGSLRLCVDYRGLNAITKPNRYPLPLVSDLLDTIRGSQIFSKLDLKSAFNLLRVAKGDEWKTAFRTNEGLYEYLVMPFGLKNAPAAWQSFIQWVLQAHLGISCIVYLDDILIFSWNQSDHDRDVLRVLQSLEDHGLYCNIEKCEFDCTELEYLGFLIRKSGVRMHPSKLDTIASWQPPVSVRGVQKWLGFMNFYQHFIKNYAKLALPLNDLTRKDSPTPFKLTPDTLTSFEAMHDAFQSAPLLMHFNHSKSSFLHTDASDFAIAAILSQYGEDSELHPVAFFSRKLTPAEINYDVHDKEMLAVIQGLKEFRPWLSGTIIPILVITDHKNLEYFMTQRQLNRRQARWMLELTEFNFHLSYAPGSKNPANGPSRCEDYLPNRDDPTILGNNTQLLTPEICKRLNPSAIIANLTSNTLDSTEGVPQHGDNNISC